MAEVGPVEKVSSPVTSTSEPKETAKDYYAWTPIRYGADVDDNGHVLKVHVANYGDKVTKSGLSLDEEEWNRLVALKVIRKAVPPKVSLHESPKRKMVADAARQMEIAQAGGE